MVGKARTWLNGLGAWYRSLPAVCRWVPPVLWMALIYWASAQPDLPRVGVGMWDTLVKKGAHAAEYAVLTLLLWQATGGARVGIAWAMAVVYAASDEFHQTFVAGRNGRIADVAIDAAGAAAAALLAWWCARRRRAA